MLTASQARQFETIFNLHHEAMVREAQRLTRGHQDAGDLVQDTYERALRSFASFRVGSNALAWLRTIMIRLYVDGWRRQRRRPFHTSVDEIELPAPAADEPPLWRTISGEELREALTALPAPTRDLLEGHALRQESYASLAGRYQLPVKTVGTRLFRSRGKLRSVLLDRQARHPRGAIAA